VISNGFKAPSCSWRTSRWYGQRTGRVGAGLGCSVGAGGGGGGVKNGCARPKFPPPDANSPPRPSDAQTEGGVRLRSLKPLAAHDKLGAASLATPCSFTRCGEWRLAGPNLARRE
jgi:hypothetical protein